MTRDDALHALVSSGLSPADSKQFLKAAYALGILKMEEPQTPDMRAGAIFNAYVSGEEAASILLEMHAAGLKIVEA